MALQKKEGFSQITIKKETQAECYIFRCHCEKKSHDSTYGNGLRLFNRLDIISKYPYYKCSVCGYVRSPFDIIYYEVPRTISVFNVCGGFWPLTSEEEGQRLFEVIVQTLNYGYVAELSFLNVAITTTAFLDSAIGQLYGIYEEGYLKRRMLLIDTDQSQLVYIKQSVECAKAYFKVQKEWSFDSSDQTLLKKE